MTKFFNTSTFKRYNRLLFWIGIIALLLMSLTQLFSLSTFKSSESGLIINEFVAANGTGLTDEDGDYSDWIEIYNSSSQPINLAGWALTDNPNQPEKWTFPNITLAAHEYLVIFVSGKNRTSVEPGSMLHTNFRLNRVGEAVALYNILDGQFKDAILPHYPEQIRDVAYGRFDHGQRDPLAESSFRYLATPTPGGPNDTTLTWTGIVSEVQFSIERGFYKDPFKVELHTTTLGAMIRYTTNGSEPTGNSGQFYTEPILITTTTVLRATASKPGFLPSSMQSQTYFFLDDVLKQPAFPPNFPKTWGTVSQDQAGYKAGTPAIADYEMDPEIVNNPRYRKMIEEGLLSIPTLSLVMDPQNLTEIYSNPMERGIAWERPVSVEFVDPTGNKENFQINAGVRIQGGYGRLEFVPKHSFRLFFRGEYGAPKLIYPLFANSHIETFDTLILRGGVQRGYAGYPEPFDHKSTTYTRDEWLRTSQIALSGVGSHGTFIHLYLNGLYWGLYNIIERPDASFLSSYLGSDEEVWYVANHNGPISGSDERIKALQELSEEIAALDYSNRYAAIAQYVDITQFIDYVILNWYAGNMDWAPNNRYLAIQNPSGQLMHFVWDGEFIWENGATINLGKRSKPPFLINTVQLIFEGAFHFSDFRIELADRLFKHLFNDGALTDSNSQERWQKINNMIDSAIVAESARWGDARYDTPITRDDWLIARDDVLRQMDGNAARLISLAREAGYYPDIDPPAFNQHGGLVPPDFELEMTAPRGTIYYTTDGSDPRLQVTGAVAPSAQQANRPMAITTNTHVKARVLDAPSSTSSDEPVWSALNEASFRIIDNDYQLSISEIMYNPVGGGDYEFIEVKNFGKDECDLAGMYFDGIDFTFPLSTPALAPDDLVVLVRNQATFAERYPGVKIGGVYSGQLSNGGETITLRNIDGSEVTSVTYDDEDRWPISPDGHGDSLVFTESQGDPNEAKNWHASQTPHGSPGTDDTP